MATNEQALSEALKASASPQGEGLRVKGLASDKRGLRIGEGTLQPLRGGIHTSGMV